MTLHIVGSDNEGAKEPQVQAVKETHDPWAKRTSEVNHRCCGQDFAGCLGLLGPLVDDLDMELWGGNAFTSESLRPLWTCSNLRSLTLETSYSDLKAEHLEAGLQHLRSPATSPLTLSINYAVSAVNQVNVVPIGHPLLTTCFSVRQAAGDADRDTGRQR